MRSIIEAEFSSIKNVLVEIKPVLFELPLNHMVGDIYQVFKDNIAKIRDFLRASYSPSIVFGFLNELSSDPYLSKDTKHIKSFQELREVISKYREVVTAKESRRTSKSPTPIARKTVTALSPLKQKRIENKYKTVSQERSPQKEETSKKNEFEIEKQKWSNAFTNVLKANNKSCTFYFSESDEGDS